MKSEVLDFIHVEADTLHKPRGAGSAAAPSIALREKWPPRGHFVSERIESNNVPPISTLRVSGG